MAAWTVYFTPRMRHAGFIFNFFIALTQYESGQTGDKYVVGLFLEIRS